MLSISTIRSEVQLRSMLEKYYGTVNYVHIPKNEEGQSKGGAIVGFRWHEDAVVALEYLNGSVLDGMVLHPQWATPSRNQKQRQPRQPIKRNGSRRRKKTNGQEAA